MKNQSTDIRLLMTYSKGGIISKVISKDDRSNVTLFCMAAGTDMSEHTSTKEGAIYIIEGDGSFRLAGKDIAMRPGVVILMEKNAKHSIQATKNTSFLLVLHD